MADEYDRTALIDALLGPVDPVRSALRLAVETPQPIDRNAMNVGPAPGLNEILARYIPNASPPRDTRLFPGLSDTLMAPLNAMGRFSPEAALAANFMVPGMKANPRPEIVPRGNGMYDVRVDGRFAGTASVAADGAKPFISAVDIQNEFRRSGIANQLYDQIEKDLGRPLVPSPLGLTPEATALWQKRLSRMNPEQRALLLAESRGLGREYGIKDADIDLRLKPLEEESR